MLWICSRLSISCRFLVDFVVQLVVQQIGNKSDKMEFGLWCIFARAPCCGFFRICCGYSINQSKSFYSGLSGATTAWSTAGTTDSVDLLYSLLYRWRGGVTVRALDLRSAGRGFKSYSRQRCVTTLGKLFTPMCLCHQAV